MKNHNLKFVSWNSQLTRNCHPNERRSWWKTFQEFKSLDLYWSSHDYAHWKMRSLRRDFVYVLFLDIQKETRSLFPVQLSDRTFWKWYWSWKYIFTEAWTSSSSAEHSYTNESKILCLLCPLKNISEPISVCDKWSILCVTWKRLDWFWRTLWNSDTEFVWWVWISWPGENDDWICCISVKTHCRQDW